MPTLCTGPNSGLSGKEDLEGGLVFYTEHPEHGSTDGSRGASQTSAISIVIKDNTRSTSHQHNGIISEISKLTIKSERDVKDLSVLH